MKQQISCLLAFLLFACLMPAQSGEINLGNIRFPSAFVHDGKNYDPGIYQMILTEKEGVPFFRVLSEKAEFLFEEMGIVRSANTGTKQFRFRLRKEMLNRREYFRVRVIQPGKWVMAYFLLKAKK